MQHMHDTFEPYDEEGQILILILKRVALVCLAARSTAESTILTTTVNMCNPHPG